MKKTKLTNIYDAFIQFEGITSADGDVGGNWLFCQELVGRPDTFTGKTILITSGAAVHNSTGISAFNPLTGRVTVSPVFITQILKGHSFKISNIDNSVAFALVVLVDLAAILADLGPASTAALGSLYAILGNPATSFALRIGNPDADTLKSLVAKLGDLQRSLRAELGTRWDAAGDLGTDITSIIASLSGATGVLKEQAAVPVNVLAVAGPEVDVFHLAAAGTRYVVRSLRLKSVDPGADNVTVRLYELINGGLINTDTFTIGTAGQPNPYTNHYSLMDMFGLPHLAGDNIQVTVQATGGAGYAVTGEYSFAQNHI